MLQTTQGGDRRTSVDEIFDELYDEISSLRLLPGARISEAEVATRFGVSRQPVRDAFSRLQNLDLLVVRPQRATEVKRFSRREIEKSRFVRAAIEAEVLRRAALARDAAGAALLDESLSKQQAAIAAQDYAAFNALDYGFHQALCTLAGVGCAFEVVSAEKAKLDRLCMLSLSREDRMPQLLEDHRAIARAVQAGDGAAAVAAGMVHLGRLDSTIATVTAENADYFEPDTD